MPFALLLIGVWLLIAGVRNTAGPATQPGTLFYLLHNDFTGPNNFIYWFLAIILIGAVGYIPKLKPVSTGFLALVLVVLFLKRGNVNGVGGGFFSQFLTGIGQSQGTNNVQSRLDGLNNQLGSNLSQQQQSLSDDANRLAQRISANGG